MSFNNLKLKNLFIKSFNTIEDFEIFKNNNPQFVVHDLKISTINDKLYIYLIYQEIKNNV